MRKVSGDLDVTPLLFSVKSQDPTSLVPCPIGLYPVNPPPKLHGFEEADGQDPSLRQVHIGGQEIIAIFTIHYLARQR